MLDTMSAPTVRAAIATVTAARKADACRQHDRNRQLGVAREPAADALDAEGRAHAEHGRAEHRVDVQQQTRRDTGERGMAECITEHGQAAQHDRHADERDNERQQHADDKRTLHERIFKHFHDCLLCGCGDAPARQEFRPG